MDEETRLKLAEMGARLDEAHKMMDKVNGREAGAVKWFGVAIGLLSSLFLGFQFVNSQRVDSYTDRAEKRLQTELEDAKKQITDALGKSIPQRVIIEDAIGDPNVLEFAAQTMGGDGKAQLRIIAPYYVVAEGAN